MWVWVKWNVALCATPFIGSEPEVPARGSSAAEKSGPAGAGSLNSERSERQKSERSEDFFLAKNKPQPLRAGACFRFSLERVKGF